MHGHASFQLSRYGYVRARPIIDLTHGDRGSRHRLQPVDEIGRHRAFSHEIDIPRRIAATAKYLQYRDLVRKAIQWR
jgi:hypothetical protein